MTVRLAPCGLLVGILLTGCSAPDTGLVEVTGTVKLKGQPIKEGTISFEPLDGRDSRATAMINDGEYSIPRESGLKPGKYLIRVSAGDGKTAVNPVDENNPPGPSGGRNIISKELVPADWNVKSKHERSVTAESPNRIDFDIP